MKYYLSLLLVVALSSFVDARDISPKWRGTMPMKDMVKAREQAEGDKKLLTVIISYEKYDSDTQGSEQVVGVIDDTIKALKSCSVIVRGDFQSAQQLKQGDEFNMALMEGLQKAGNSLPMIIVLDPVNKKLIEVIKPNDVLQQGSKAFRSVKKAARNLKKN